MRNFTNKMRTHRGSALAGAAYFGLLSCLATPGYAQTTPPAADQVTPQIDSTPNTPEDGEIVVTGSRIARSGFEAPTPLTVIGEQELKSQATSNNIADYVNQIPSVAGSVRPANSRISISSGVAGVNALNLRNMGIERTLVLLDGHRSVGSTITGAVDVNDFPQSLIKSVEIVTGGASAAYGSDAVSGVVNFILDKDYTGIKATLEGGETNYGDGKNYMTSLTAGMKFAGGRGHLLLNGEIAHRAGIFETTRDWNLRGDRTFLNPNYKNVNGVGNGLPQYLVVTHGGSYNALPGGMINGSKLANGQDSTLLRGTYFGPGGVSKQYAYGSLTNTTSTVGGDWALSDYGTRNGLDPSDDRQGVFGRLSFELSDAITVFAEGSYNHHHAITNAGPLQDSAVTIKSGNPFIPAAIQADMIAKGIASFSMGTTNYDLGYRITDNERSVQRYVLGADGKFAAFGTDVKWDIYGQHGVTDTFESARDISNTAKLAMATDVVYAPAGNAAGIAAGTIVCASTLTNPGNGCIPLNRIGTGVADPAAIDYVLGDPQRRQQFKQDVVALNFSFDAFKTWAGTVAIATGYEHRREEVSGSVDPIYSTGWAVGNFLPTFGHYSVDEAYVEALVPLAEGLDFNGAVRGTNYSTSGYVTTWKAGATYQPIPDIRFRMTRSRDIRAPNLSELYQAGFTRTNTLADPFNNRQSTVFRETATGNPDLVPEVADSTNVGVVFQPRFLPGLSASVDLYDIHLKGAIGIATSQQVLDRCYVGKTEFCDLFTRDPGVSPELTVQVSPVNFAEIRSRGLDFDVAYRLPLSDLSSKLDGTLTLRGMATHYLKNYTDNGVDVPRDTVGENGDGGTPKWLYRLSASYVGEPWSLTVSGRGISSGVISNTYIVCSTGCPTATVDNPTIDYNHAAGSVFVDLNMTRNVKVGRLTSQLYFSVTNLFNRDPITVPSSPTYYDLLGRTFRGGVRFSFK